MKSRLYLPKLDPVPQSILDYLRQRFPHIPASTWRERMARGQVAVDDGTAVTPDSAYRHGITILYSKEVPREPLPDLQEVLLYRDANILVADKPHGMVVTPSGTHVERSLLFRLRRSTGLAALTPIHRLDRETAGLVLFSILSESRDSYHRLFSERLIEREYLAVATVGNITQQKEWHLETRMGAGEPWFRRRIVEDSEGEPNAITHIECVELRNRLGLFRLRPETGKKHQLRVHMASIGFPIVGDTLYPEIREQQEGDPPLQLLARSLSYSDPLSGEPRRFTSTQKLLWPVE
jgi:tRNA pseudouridine32 synthase/23S rRNA pseudouridine746 synthase